MGRKTFACDFGGRTILKLDKGHQELLFEIRPETFSRCRVGTGYWSYVELADLDEAELAALLLEGWTSIVPRKVSKPHLASLRQVQAEFQENQDGAVAGRLGSPLARG